MQKVLEQLPQLEINNGHPKHPILFIHGFNSSYQVHEAFYTKSHKSDYYAISLPGNNLLPATDEQLNLHYYAKLIVAYIKSKNLANLILMGHSMGGGIISLVAELVPNLISKMIYIAPMNKTSLALEEIFFKDYFPQDVNGLHKFIKNLYYDSTFLANPKIQIELAQTFNYDLYNNVNIKKLGQSLPSLVLMDQLEYALNKLTIPVLLILGEDDGIIKRDECKAYFQQHVANIEVVIVPKTGHMIFKEAPEFYISLVENFIAK